MHINEILALKIGLKKAIKIWNLQSNYVSIIAKTKKLKFYVQFIKPLNSIYIAKSKDILNQVITLDKKIQEPLNCSTDDKNKIKRYLETQGLLQKKIGILFGYPECCINEYIRFSETDFFNKFMKNNNDQPNFLINSYKNTENKFKFNYLLNNISSKRLISHFPCSYECNKSIVIAQTILDHNSENRKKNITNNLKKSIWVIDENNFSHSHNSGEEFRFRNEAGKNPLIES